MRLIKSAREMSSFSLKAKSHGKKIAFVPTMGALHEGHLSLVTEAKKLGAIVVVSIFVNPIQFGPAEDFERYPRDIKKDKKLLKNLNVDALFLPPVSEIFPKGFRTCVAVEELSKKLCGRSRPEHFRGVTTMVSKLFNIVLPDYALFGEKDYQQQAIIRQMARDLNQPVEVRSFPTVREYDGLAMSSRNRYLGPAERKSAVVLYKALNLGRRLVEDGERESKKILSPMRSLIFSEAGIRIDYLMVIDPVSLDEIEKIKQRAVIAVAAYLGKTRLIDNMTVSAR